MPPRSSSPICERSLDLTLIGIGRRDIPQCSSKHFHMEAFYQTFSGGQRPSKVFVLPYHIGFSCSVLGSSQSAFLLNSHRGQDHGRRQAIKRIPIKDLISEDGTRELTASLDMEPYIRSAMAVIHT